MHDGHEQHVVVVGRESVGKSHLISSLTGRTARSGNYRGTTVSCEVYPGPGFNFVDTPGIERRSDSVATRMALERLHASDLVLLVVQATNIDQDLAELLPVVENKRGMVAVTFADKIEREKVGVALSNLSSEAGVPFVPVDARRLGDQEKSALLGHLAAPMEFAHKELRTLAGWSVEPRKTFLENRFLGPLLGLLLLLGPAIAAVFCANTFAALVDGQVGRLIQLAVEAGRRWPAPLQHVLLGRYGFITMFPLMFVWAVPTVVLYAFIVGAYKASGLIDRINVLMHAVMHPFGLAGRDVVRVLMGFGCNVPAVISTRSCSASTRGATVSAIAFGSACSYQLGATLGVFSAAGQSWLVVPYLLFLTASTLGYLRVTSDASARSRLSLLVSDKRNFLEWPSWRSLWMEAGGTLRQFFQRALPIFIAITVVASVLDALGAVRAVSGWLEPAMRFFRLPAEAALPVAMASVRKDGILLFAAPEILAKMTPGQILTGVYLAGVFLPCLVTVLTITREQGRRFTAWLVLRHVGAALLFVLVLGWGSRLLER